MPIEIPITQRARQYGYITWPKKRTSELRQLLGEHESVTVDLDGTDLGPKRIDWKYCRISLGPRKTQSLPESATLFVLDVTTVGTLTLEIR